MPLGLPVLCYTQVKHMFDHFWVEYIMIYYYIMLYQPYSRLLTLRPSNPQSLPLGQIPGTPQIGSDD